MNSNRVITLVVILLFSLGAYWFTQNYKISEREISTGYDGEVRTNDYYAARQFLRRMGFDARTLSTLDLHNQAYGENNTLLYIGSRLSLGEQRSRQLLDWVSRGGHLIIKPEHILSVDDAKEDAPVDTLLDELNVYAYYYEFEDDVDVDVDVDVDDENTEYEYAEEADSSNTEYDDSADDTTVTDIDAVEEEVDMTELTIDGHEVTNEFYNSNYLVGSRPEDTTASDKLGIQWLSRPIGAGHVSVLTEFTPFLNWRIDMHQHAQLLRIIAARQATQEDIIWLLHETDMPPLWKLILNSALPVVIGATAMLLIWLWGSLFRFGPIVREPEPAQRQLQEHLDAAGHHQKRYAPAALFTSTQSALHQHIMRLYPQWQSLDTDEKSELLQKKLKLSETRTRLVLSKPKSMAPNELFAAIKTLQSIRKTL